MAFVKGTQLFTDSGWKNIEDIQGRDRVLVRNFLGGAQFMQPFALKKKSYKGEIHEIGAQNWKIAATPEHIIVYDYDDIPKGNNFTFVPIKDVTPHKNKRIYRKFKYITAEEYKPETIVIHSDFGRSWVTISNHDWFTLVAYVLCRSYIKPEGRKHTLNIHLDRDKRESELVLLGDILDRIGVEWELIQNPYKDAWTIKVNNNNTLATKLASRLGSKKRKKMYIPDTMIYNSSKDLAVTLIEAIVSVSKRSKTQRGTSYQFSSNNERLVSTLSLLGTLYGYSMQSSIVARKGEAPGRGELSKDVYRLKIQDLAKTYSPTYKKTYNYDDKVYEIYLMDGQVYVKNGSVPIWVNPK